MNANENRILKFLEEVTAGADHEINNLLLMIEGTANLLGEESDPAEREKSVAMISDKVTRIYTVMNELRSVIRDGHADPMDAISLKSVCTKIIDLCKARYKNHRIFFNVNVGPELSFKGRETEIIQALLGVLNFCHSRIMQHPQKWIKLNVFEIDSDLYIDIEDSGHKFKSFELNGNAVSMSKGIIEDNFGSINLINDNENALIRITFPKIAGKIEVEADLHLRTA